MLGAKVVEHEAVGAQFLYDFPVPTVVIFVALPRIGEITVRLGTLIRYLFLVLLELLLGGLLLPLRQTYFPTILLERLLLPRQTGDRA